MTNEFPACPGLLLTASARGAVCICFYPLETVKSLFLLSAECYFVNVTTAKPTLLRLIKKLTGSPFLILARCLA